jgi:uncharacterized NAD(P)/FAD-binding protein YdhS
VGIVGAGPRGTIALDRVVANADLVPDRPIVVHLVDPAEPGAGRVFRTDQSPELLMNTVCADVTVFTDDSVRCAGPVRPGPSVYQWARLVADGTVADGLPAAVVAEARRLEPWTYATRAFTGHYLSWAVRHVAAGAPARVAVELHRQQAVAVDDLPGGGQLLRLADGTARPVDALVLATGHSAVRPTAGEARLRDFAAGAGLRYVLPASPADVDLDAVAPGEPVLLRGLGLNFFDYVALLTAGRGGRFERTGDGLAYRPSGREPLLWAGSRRGTPHASRPEVRQAVPAKHRPRFLTDEAVDAFRRQAGCGRLDFVRDVWPYVVREVEWVYYDQVLAGDPDRRAAVRAVLDGLAPGDPAVPARLADLVPEPGVRLDWAALHRPAAGRRFRDHADYTGWIRGRLREDVGRSLAGPDGSPAKALAAALRDLRAPISRVVSHQGLRGGSYRADLEDWFTGLFNTIANGPPVLRVEQLGALVDAGVVRFLGPDLRVTADPADPTGPAFTACSPAVPGEPVRARVLIDAWLHDTDLRRTADPLLGSLVRGGQARPHVIPDGEGDPYRTGGLDVTEGAQEVVDAAGRPHPGRFAYGPPIESVQWLTATIARPGSNSSTLLQGDLIARRALVAAARSA